ncbi:MAG: hypothetical protein AAFP92_05180 [Bacteroidota bacterium]
MIRYILLIPSFLTIFSYFPVFSQIYRPSQIVSIDPLTKLPDKDAPFDESFVLKIPLSPRITESDIASVGYHYLKIKDGERKFLCSKSAPRKINDDQLFFSKKGSFNELLVSMPPLAPGKHFDLFIQMRPTHGKLDKLISVNESLLVGDVNQAKKHYYHYLWMIGEVESTYDCYKGTGTVRYLHMPFESMDASSIGKESIIEIGNQNISVIIYPVKEISNEKDSSEIEFHDVVMAEKTQTGENALVRKELKFNFQKNPSENYIKLFNEKLKPLYESQKDTKAVPKVEEDVRKKVFEQIDSLKEVWITCDCGNPFSGESISSEYLTIPVLIQQLQEIFTDNTSNQIDSISKGYKIFGDFSTSNVSYYELERRLKNIESSQKKVKLILGFLEGKPFSPKAFYQYKELQKQLSAFQKYLQNSDTIIRSASNSINKIIKGNYLLTYSESFYLGTGFRKLKTKASHILIPDVGIAYMVPLSNDQVRPLVRPYLGVNINFRPINKDIPFRHIRNKNLGSYISLTLGLTAFSFENEEGISDLFNKMSLLTGVGVRPHRAFRISFGAVTYKKSNPNPLLADRVAVMPYGAFSIDVDLLEFFKKISSKVY